jgi:cytochrome c oxidase assembly protein subunit 15
MLNRRQSARFFHPALAALVIAFLSLLFNAYTRLSDIGASCPDWPSCYERLFTDKPVQAGHTLEYVGVPKNMELKRTLSRSLYGALGVMLLWLAALAWKYRKRLRDRMVQPPLVVTLLIFAPTVIWDLNVDIPFRPFMVMTQLLGGALLIAMLWWIVLREVQFWRPVNVTAFTRSLRPHVVAALVLVAAQIALGGWSVANYAGLACLDFPTCQGQWWPAMDFQGGFVPGHDVVPLVDGQAPDMSATTAIHMAHRLGALMTMLYVGWLSWHVLLQGAQENLCRYGLLILIILAVELTLGVLQMVAHLPLLLAVLHSGAAVLLLLGVITLYHVVRPPQPV